MADIQPLALLRLLTVLEEEDMADILQLDRQHLHILAEATAHTVQPAPLHLHTRATEVLRPLLQEVHPHNILTQHLFNPQVRARLQQLVSAS